MGKENFFNVIGVADMERVHSAVIAWMLSDECEAMNVNERSALLNDLFKRDGQGSLASIKAYVEWNDIDILVLTENLNGDNECWVIENKIKTSQHSNQLEKYKEIVDEKFKDCGKHFVFLTLIGETALAGNGEWVNTTYETLMKSLEKHLNVSPDNADSVILGEYYRSIRQLVGVSNEFISHPESYPTVFTDGSTKKEDKSERHYDNETSRFIGMNGLETIFQKMYFAQVLHDVLSSSNIKCESWHIGETRGNADFAIHLNGLAKNTFLFDMAFQNGTFKFAVCRNYWTDTSAKNIREVLAWSDDMRELQKLYPDYSRMNSARSRARISVSKKIEVNGGHWYQMPRDKFCSLVKAEFENAYNMMNDIVKIHEARIGSEDV